MTSNTILYIAASFDGYVAGPNDEVDWMDRYENVEYGLNDFLSRVGAIIMGRRSYDVGVEQNWFTRFDYGSPIVVVSNDTPKSLSRDGDFTFVTEGIEAAHAQAKAKQVDLRGFKSSPAVYVMSRAMVDRCRGA